MRQWTMQTTRKSNGCEIYKNWQKIRLPVVLYVKKLYVTKYLILIPWMCIAYLDDSGIYTHLTKCVPGVELKHIVLSYSIKYEMNDMKI